MCLFNTIKVHVCIGEHDVYMSIVKYTIMVWIADLKSRIMSVLRRSAGMFQNCHLIGTSFLDVPALTILDVEK